MENIGNTCFANSVYKLIARCPGFDQVLNKDVSGGIHTALRNIVNGIRLGKKSAFEQSHIQGEMSKNLLKTLSDKDELKRRYDDGKQHFTLEFLLDIQRLLYPEESYTIKPEHIGAYTKQVSGNPFESLVKEIAAHGDPSTRMEILDFFDVNDHFYKLPLFFVSYRESGTSPKSQPIIESRKVTLFDYRTDQPIGEKTYKLIAFVHNSGSSPASGHAVAYVNFNAIGWYLHDDPRVSPVSLPNSLNTMGLLGIYQLQD